MIHRVEQGAGRGRLAALPAALTLATLLAAPAAGQLVINEIDYDQPGSDDAEFIEIRNNGAAAVDLGGYDLTLVDQTGPTVDATITLPAVTLAPGGYFVVCGDPAKVANCDLDATPDTDLIEDGVDAVELRDAGGTRLDVVSYEGDVAGFVETAGVSPGDNDADLAVGIGRDASGADTGDNSGDFSVQCITPGADNDPMAVMGCAVPVVVSATKVDTLAVDNDSDTVADPGDTLRYNVEIEAVSSDAVDARFEDTVGSDTTLVGGSVNVTPLAFDDAYDAFGNTRLDVSVPAEGVLQQGTADKDFLGDPCCTIDDSGGGFPVTISSDNGTDNVSLAADGTFTYDPPLGFQGDDTFTYTLVDSGGLTGDGLVTITVDALVWYIDNTGGGSGGTGTSSDPFKTLGDFNAANGGGAGKPAAGDPVFVREGTATYDGGITLLANQVLIGQGSDLVVDHVNLGTTILETATADPTLTNSGGDGITLASGNTVRGLTVDGSSGANVKGSSIAAGTFENVSTTGSTTGIDLTNATGTFTFDSATSISPSSGSAVTINGHSAGTFSFDGTINATGGDGLQFTNADGIYDFNTTSGSTTLNGGDAGIDILSDSSGTFTFGASTTITNPTGIAFRIDGGTAGNVDYNGTISQSNAFSAVQIFNKTGGTVTFAGSVTANTGGTAGINLNANPGAFFTFRGGLDIDTASGFGFNATAGGTINVCSDTACNGGGTPVTNTVDTTGGGGSRGVVISDTIGSFGVTFNSVNVGATSAADSGIVLASTGTGTFTVTSGTIQQTTSRGFDANNVDGTVSLGTTISNSSGRTVEIDGGSSGSFTFSAAIDENADGIRIADSAGTFNFSGGLALDTGANTAFTATNGGTVNVTGTNTIGAAGAVSGTAINIASTSIGASGITLQSIDFDGGGTATSAIVLDSTGTGAFSVTGDGTTATVGGNGTGGTIRNAIGADAIRLKNTSGAMTFQNVLVEDIGDPDDSADPHGTRSGADGIHGEMVGGGLVLKNVTLRRFSDNAVNGAAADGISLTTFDGLEIRDSHLENSNRYHVGPEDGTGKGDDSAEGMVRINGIDGTVIVTGSSFNRGAQFLDFQTPLAGALTMTVQNNTFTKTLKEFKCSPDPTPPLGVPISVGKAGIALLVKGSTTVDAFIGDAATPALGNTFTDNGSASIVILHDAGTSGEIDTVISNNDFVVLDHLTGPASCPGGSLQFFHPQGGVHLGPGAGAFEALVTDNLFDQVMHADGGLGQLTIVMDSGGSAEIVVQGNEFKLPWDAGVEIKADANGSAAIRFGGSGAGEANTYTEGVVGVAVDDVCASGGGPFCPVQSPFNPFHVNVRNGGSLDLTVEDEILHQHDDVNSAFANSFNASINASGGTLDLAIFGNTECTTPPSATLCDSKSPDGYRLEQNGGTFNLFTKGSCPATAASILSINDNSGGGGMAGVPNPAVDGDDTKPPTVVASGTINCTTTAPTLPSLTIP